MGDFLSMEDSFGNYATLGFTSPNISSKAESQEIILLFRFLTYTICNPHDLQSQDLKHFDPK